MDRYDTVTAMKRRLSGTRDKRLSAAKPITVKTGTIYLGLLNRIGIEAHCAEIYMLKIPSDHLDCKAAAADAAKQLSVDQRGLAFHSIASPILRPSYAHPVIFIISLSFDIGCMQSNSMT